MLLLVQLCATAACIFGLRYGTVEKWHARTHTNAKRIQCKKRPNERMKERESNVDAGGFLWLFQFPVNADGFFIPSLCAVCIPVQQKIPAAAAAALINLLRYNIKCVCVCVFGTCLISRFLFILIWFLFMLLKFIRCHAVDFTLMSEFRSSHSETDFKSVQCTLLALRVFKLYYLFNFTKKNFSWFDDDGISVCVSNPYQPNRNVEWQP